MKESDLFSKENNEIKETDLKEEPSVLEMLNSMLDAKDQDKISRLDEKGVVFSAEESKVLLEEEDDLIDNGITDEEREMLFGMKSDSDVETSKKSFFDKIKASFCKKKIETPVTNEQIVEKNLSEEDSIVEASQADESSSETLSYYEEKDNTIEFTPVDSVDFSDSDMITEDDSAEAPEESAEEPEEEFEPLDFDFDIDSIDSLKTLKLTSRQETFIAVEDAMCKNETRGERAKRHFIFLQNVARERLPKVDLSDVDFLSDVSFTEEQSEGTESFAYADSGIKKKHGSKAVILTAACFAVAVLAFVVFFTMTPVGQGITNNVTSTILTKFAFSKIKEPTEEQKHGNVNNGEGELVVVADNTSTPTPVPETTAEPTPDAGTPSNPDSENQENSENQSEENETVISSPIVNILLIGEEKITKGSRADSILIASFDKEKGTLKVISLMRDLLVDIPVFNGYSYKPNKLNAAYSYGGAEHLMKTVETNLGVSCDSYIIVDFEGFEKIIDTIGGIDITVTKEEADYLNSTNYIKDKVNRTIVEGENHMNGAQAIGFCRIRKPESSDNEHADFGRTYRQRTVLKKVFDKLKVTNYATLLNVVNECFNYISAPAELESTVKECLRIALDKQIYNKNLETFRIPASGHYWPEIEETKDAYGNVLKKEMIGFDEENVNLLRLYIYGSEN